MKNLVNVTSTFSVFGNLSSFISGIESIKSSLEGFDCREGNEQLPNGLPSKNFILQKDNVAVVIRSYRLDFQFGYRNENDKVEDFLKFVEDMVKKLSSVSTIKFNRVSFNDVNFVLKDEETLRNFAEIFNANNVFGANADELQVRINNIISVSNEDTNAVILMQDGFVAKKNPDGNDPRQAVIFINNDINTLAQNREQRFTLEEASKLFVDFVMVGKERTNTILSRI
jgi:hypothetical protein